jgi:hypothetical protein
MKQHTLISTTLFLFLAFIISSAGYAQEAQEYQINVEPEKLSLNVDDQTQLTATLQRVGGGTTQDTVVFYSRARSSVSVTPEGKVKAIKPGSFEIIAVVEAPNEERIYKTIPVEIAYPPITEITFRDMPSTIYGKTVTEISYDVTDAKGFDRKNADVSLSSSDPSVASVDEFGRLHAKKPGSVTITASAEDTKTIWQTQVKAHPVTSIEINKDKSQIRTGDVVHFKANPMNQAGNTVNDVPVTYSFISKTDDDLGEGTSGQIQPDGRFVANKPGLYTITAKSGTAMAEHTIRVDARNVQKNLRVVGHGLVSDVHTSDLWVWEGVDGGDYAITGTWGGNGEAYFWDVSDPSNMTIIDTVTVDARTVNDVKISEDGRIGVITRAKAPRTARTVLSSWM